MDAKSLKEITSELSLLYVEDNTDLRNETGKLFGHLFNTVDTAYNGKDALEKLLTRGYDLVITDINMPVMDGVELTKHIRENNVTQPIIVTSAHDESSYLLELIELGIDKFILKPLDIQKVIPALSFVCSKIVNEKLVIQYKQELEASNIQLKDSNEELELLVNILETKIKQLSMSGTSCQQESSASTTPSLSSVEGTIVDKTQVLNNRSNDDLYPDKKDLRVDDLKELQHLETDMSAAAVLINLQKRIEPDIIIHLSNMLYQYSQVLRTYTAFNVIPDETTSLALSLKERASVCVAHINDISASLESFLYVLKKWRTALFEKGTKEPHMYETSMINDIQAIIMILSKDETA